VRHDSQDRGDGGKIAGRQRSNLVDARSAWFDHVNWPIVNCAVKRRVVVRPRRSLTGNSQVHAASTAKRFRCGEALGLEASKRRTR
jgi:hypothetical protein